MKQFEKRLRVLETAAGVAEDWTTKPWRRVIVGVGESEVEAFKREGIGSDENVIVRILIAPGGERCERGGLSGEAPEAET